MGCSRTARLKSCPDTKHQSHGSRGRVITQALLVLLPSCLPCMPFPGFQSVHVHPKKCGKSVKRSLHVPVSRRCDKLLNQEDAPGGPCLRYGHGCTRRSEQETCGRGELTKSNPLLTRAKP